MGRKKTISDTDLLAVARQVFVEKGFGASTREIARKAGISEGILFQRFTTKADLFFAAMILPPVDLNHILHHGSATGCELMEKVTFAMIDYFREILPVLIPLSSHPGFRFEEFASRHPGSPLSALRQELSVFFVHQRNAGAIGAVNPGAAALLVWSIAHTIVFFEHLGAHGGKFQPEMIKATVQCAWDGLAPGQDLRNGIL